MLSLRRIAPQCCQTPPASGVQPLQGITGDAGHCFKMCLCLFRPGEPSRFQSSPRDKGEGHHVIRTRPTLHGKKSRPGWALNEVFCMAAQVMSAIFEEAGPSRKTCSRLGLHLVTPHIHVHRQQRSPQRPPCLPLSKNRSGGVASAVLGS